MALTKELLLKKINELDVPSVKKEEMLSRVRREKEVNDDLIVWFREEVQKLLDAAPIRPLPKEVKQEMKKVEREIDQEIKKVSKDLSETIENTIKNFNIQPANAS